MTARIHRLKTHPEPFKAIKYGFKTAEFRKNDRGFHVGDLLILEDYDPGTETYSGESIYKNVSHVQEGFGIPEGYVMLSLV